MEFKSKIKEMIQIKNWLDDNDYIVNKHSLGEYKDNDIRWLSYLNDRKLKLERYNELEQEIKNKRR